MGCIGNEAMSRGWSARSVKVSARELQRNVATISLSGGYIFLRYCAVTVNLQ